VYMQRMRGDERGEREMVVVDTLERPRTRSKTSD
jgi:hypothetical protein